jgi:hypothetical protein
MGVSMGVSDSLSGSMYCLLRGRDSLVPSICEESLSRKPRLEPLREVTEGVRDKDWELRRGSFHGDMPPMGDGKGVMSPMAIS